MFISPTEGTGSGTNDFQLVGLPADPNPWMIPGLESTVAAQGSTPKFMEHPLDWLGGEIGKIYQTGKDITKTVYGDLRNAAGTVYDDVSKPVEGAISKTYWHLILGIVVIGGVIYFAGKSGAIRIQA